MMIFEDFVPLTDKFALVTRGESLTSLTEIVRDLYLIEQGVIRLFNRGEILVRGKHLRLGNMTEVNGLCFSDRAIGLVGTPVTSRTGIQPFVADNGDCYWNEPLAHGDCPAGAPQGIYRNGERFLKHWLKGGVVGKPAVSGKWLYFEARNPDAKMPQGWEVWRKNLDDDRLEFIRIGANPHPWNGHLFFTDFSAYPEFCTRCEPHDVGA